MKFEGGNLSIRRNIVEWYQWGCCALMCLSGAFVLADTQQPRQGNHSSNEAVVIEAVDKISSTSFLSNLVDMELMDQDGRSFEVDSLVDRVALFNFIFTRCGGTCPMQTRVLAQVFQQLPADVRSQVRFVSISVDPTNDTPAQLQRFAKTMNADLDGWSFLTGDAEQIDRLLQRLHIFEESDQANNPQIHRTALWLVDQRGRMLQRYQGDPPDKDRLIREIAQVSHLIVR